MPVLHFDVPEHNGGGGGSRRERRRQHRLRALTDLANNHLFFVLPSPSLAETAARLTRRTGNPWTPHEVSRLQTFTRDFVRVIGWMVTMGKATRNPAQDDRFFQALLNHDGTYWSDYQHVQVLDSQLFWMARGIKMFRRMRDTSIAQGNHTLDPLRAGLQQVYTLQLDLTIQAAEALRAHIKKNGP